jgi:hypothetical protein
MFVRGSVYRAERSQRIALEAACNLLRSKYTEAINEWNKLIKRINDKGGEEFLTDGIIASQPQLTLDEIKTIISLCHPDKHGNSERSNEITKRLLALKASAEKTEIVP